MEREFPYLAGSADRFIASRRFRVSDEKARVLSSACMIDSRRDCTQAFLRQGRGLSSDEDKGMAGLQNHGLTLAAFLLPRATGVKLSDA